MSETAIETRLLDIARELIDARKRHFHRVMVAFEKCIYNSPDAPTGPSAEGERLSMLWTGLEKKLIAMGKDAPSSPISDAVRAYAHCYRSGRVISRGFNPDDPADKAISDKILNDYLEESTTVWNRLAELAGVDPPEFTRTAGRRPVPPKMPPKVPKPPALPEDR